MVPIMTALGDAASLTGNSVDDLATIYGQMFAKGKVANEELLQLTERGVPGYQILADKLGLSVAEVQKLASEGKLGAQALSQLQAGIEERFGGGMAKQAKTLGGMISTLKDTLSGILTNIGTAVLPIAKTVFPLVQSGAEKMGAKITSLMPRMINGLAAGVQQLLSMPGVLLRGLASMASGISNFVAGVQRSFGDVAGAMKTQSEGTKIFNSLTASAKAADAAVAPIKSKLEQTRQAAQQSMKLELVTQQADAKIAKIDADLARLKANRANPKLDVDKSHWDAKIKAAEAERKRLVDGKDRATIDAEIGPLRGKVVAAKAQMLALKALKPTPEIRAKIADLEAKVKSGKAKLDDLNKKRPTPRADLSTAKLNASAASASKRVRALDKAKAVAKADLDYSGVRSGAAAAQRSINGIRGRTVTVTIRQKKVGSRPTGGGSTSDFRAAAFSSSPTAAAARSLAGFAGSVAGLASAVTSSSRKAAGPGSLSAALSAAGLDISGGSINISTPAPQITIVTRDAALAGFIDVRIDGKSANAVQKQDRQQVMQL